jgi:hypothetical protein
LGFRERPIPFSSQPFEEKKSSDKACQIRGAIPADANIAVKPDKKWVEMMNVEREPHRPHERSGTAEEFKELVGVQEFRSSGVQGVGRSSGVQEFRSSGVGAITNCKTKRPF